MDQPRGHHAGDTDDGAADRDQPGAGRVDDDDLLRADRGRAGPAAAGIGHAAASAQPGDHLDRAVHDLAGHVARLDTRCTSEAIVPYSQREISLEEAWNAGVKPIRQFMSAQIERTGNTDDVWLFYKYLPAGHSGAGELRRRAAHRVVAGLHAQRAEDLVSDRLSDLPAVSGARHGRGQRDDLDGHADVAAGDDLVALQAAVVRAGRRLAPGRGHAAG